jgi:hypothetical protein
MDSDYLLKSDKTTPRNIALGLNGEKFIVRLLESFLGSRRLESGEYRIEHTDFEHYSWGSGVDLKVWHKDKLKIAGEVKNLKNQDRPYGTDFVRNECLPRYEDMFGIAEHLVLFISYIHLLTKEGLRLLGEFGIEVIEIGEWIVKKTWARVMKDFRIKFYHKIRGMVGIPRLNKNCKSDTTKAAKRSVAPPSLLQSTTNHTKSINSARSETPRKH